MFNGLFLLALLWAGAGFASDKPMFLGGIQQTHYNGVSDDLLTAGLGKDGLGSATAPSVSVPPTARELRRLAIYNNYRALVDMTPGGGYGVLYGPNVSATGQISPSSGLIAGDEYLALASTDAGRNNVTLLVQVPTTFDPAHACIVAAPASGSRGIYGAIASAGEPGLKRGCAVAYTDKGVGTGAHDLTRNTVYLVDGRLSDAAVAAADSTFTAPLSDRLRALFNATYPNRFALKHAHSGQNPERDWGLHVLEAVQFAFYVLSQQYGIEFTPANTLVIGAGVSNGGGAVLRAAEQDSQGLIAGVVAGEPNVNPSYDPGFVIRQGEQPAVIAHSRPLYDYITLVMIYQGCANRAPALAAAAPYNLTPALFGVSRCASLAAKGLLTGAITADQSIEAQQIINQYGILPEQNELQPSHWLLSAPQAVAVAYAMAYARQPVQQPLCKYSFGATDPNTGFPVPLDPGAAAILFGVSNGIAPTGGINIINDASLGGPRLDRASLSPSTGRFDENLDGALCLRALATGRDPVSGAPISGSLWTASQRIQNSLAQIRASGQLQGKPALIVTGRNDAVLPPNHTSRAYVGLNQRREGAASNLHYYEITHAQHLDALNALPGFDSRYLPLHYYYLQAFRLLFDHLTTGAPLPPSQVIRTIPREVDLTGYAPPIDPARNLPAIARNPDPTARITLTDNVLVIPE